MEISQANDGSNEPTHHEESLTVATSSKKTQSNPVRKREENRNTRKKQWLQDIKLSNSFSAPPEETATDPTERPTTRIAKPPPIYIDAKIIDLSLNC